MIRLHQLQVQAGSFHLQDVSFQVDTGTHACLIGKTGTGKTTLLEAICGLRFVQHGQVWLDGVDVTGLAPNLRRCGYLPQDLALFPTMNVEQHLGFALRFIKASESFKVQQVQELAEWLQLTHLLKRLTHNLSGGEKQRVALGRAIAAKPSVLLLDEPFSSLDDETRMEMQRLLAELKSTQITILHVTHQQSDVQHMADQILRLDQGKIVSESINRHDTA